VCIIFVNDGSTDSTKSLLEEWIEKHENARLVNKENGGYSSAINEGLNHCRTEYVMFLGVDDEIKSERLNELCDLANIHHPDIFAFSTIKTYDDILNNNIEKDPLTNFTDSNYYELDAFDIDKSKHDDSRILFTRDTSRMFKMAVIGELRYFGNTGVSADGCFSSLVAFRARSFQFANKDCYIWHVHHDSVSSRVKGAEKVIEEATVWQQYFSTIQREHENKRLPSVVISHIYVYKNIVEKLKEMGYQEIAEEHERAAQTFLRWIKNSKYISFSSRLKILFPGLYKSLVKIVSSR
jgi:glycosyltransferase involved in cell wall biosynthesis